MIVIEAFSKVIPTGESWLKLSLKRKHCPKSLPNPDVLYGLNISTKGTQIRTHRMAFFTINIWLENFNGSFDVSFKSNEANDILITIY